MLDGATITAIMVDIGNNEILLIELILNINDSTIKSVETIYNSKYIYF